MSRHRLKLSSAARLIIMLFAFLFALASCSGSPDVEEDASAESDDTVASTESAESEVADGDDAADTDTDAEAEADAMGEDDDAMADDAMGEDDAHSTDSSDESDAGSTDNASNTTTTPLSDAELEAALAAGTSDRFSLPFMYITAEQDCDGCAPNVSLYYVPGPDKASILTLEGAYVDGVLQSDFSAVDPVLQAGDPRRVAEQLSGTEATFGIDPVSGAITSWTLEGNSVNLRCLQVDTRPVDMRTELCENSIIG